MNKLLKTVKCLFLTAVAVVFSIVMAGAIICLLDFMDNCLFEHFSVYASFGCMVVLAFFFVWNYIDDK